MTADPRKPPAWDLAVELVAALDARGVRIALASIGRLPDDDTAEVLRRCVHATVFESEVLPEWAPDAWSDVDAAGRWLLSLERELQPDLVHLNHAVFGSLGFQAPRLVVVHSCVGSWWRAVHGVPAPPAWDEYRHRVRAGLLGASRVAAPTRAMLQSLAADYAWRSIGKVVPNGCSAEGIDPGEKLPLVFGSGEVWDEGTGLASLPAVARGLSWPVRMAGSATRDDGSTAIPADVQWLGTLSRDRMAEELAAASIYVLPASYEPWGLGVIRAALSGCALVLGDIASLRETWGPAARFVRPGDTAGLRTTLEQLIAHPAERHRFAQAAQARARRYSASAMADGYLALYAQLAPRFAELTGKSPRRAFPQAAPAASV